MPFAAVGLPAETKVYARTFNGWCPPDCAMYHKAQAGRTWSRLPALFEVALA